MIIKRPFSATPAARPPAPPAGVPRCQAERGAARLSLMRDGRLRMGEGRASYKGRFFENEMI